VGEGGELIHHLAGKSQANPDGLGRHPGEKAVIKASAVTEPMTATIKNSAGYYRYVDGSRRHNPILLQRRQGFGYPFVSGSKIMALFGEDDSQHLGVCRLTQRHTDLFPLSPTAAYQDGRFDLTAKMAVNEKKMLLLKNRQGNQGLDNPLTPGSSLCRGYCVALR
jgi:hypothetical protein